MGGRRNNKDYNKSSNSSQSSESHKSTNSSESSESSNHKHKHKHKHEHKHKHHKGPNHKKHHHHNSEKLEKHIKHEKTEHKASKKYRKRRTVKTNKVIDQKNRVIDEAVQNINHVKEMHVYPVDKTIHTYQTKVIYHKKRKFEKKIKLHTKRIKENSSCSLHSSRSSRSTRSSHSSNTSNFLKKKITKKKHHHDSSFSHDSGSESGTISISKSTFTNSMKKITRKLRDALTRSDTTSRSRSESESGSGSGSGSS